MKQDSSTWLTRETNLEHQNKAVAVERWNEVASSAALAVFASCRGQSCDVMQFARSFIQEYGRSATKNTVRDIEVERYKKWATLAILEHLLQDKVVT